MKLKPLFWIIPCSILLIGIVLFSLSSPTKQMCGDGKCSEKEIQNRVSVCDLDCKDECIQSTAGIEDIEQTCSIGWDSIYIQLVDQGILPREYLMETDEIDFSNEKVREIALYLKRDTPKETAKAIAQWTEFNILYNGDLKYNDCYNKKASEIINEKIGLCSTMSKVNIALLRANGIPAYSITGCWKYNTACNLKQTFFAKRLPKIEAIMVDESGYAATKGGLHNWVIIPLYDDGKIEDIILESTAGNLYTDTCINYRKYYINPEDSKACGLSEFDDYLDDCRGW